MPAAIAVAASTRTDAAPPPPQALDANQPSSGLPSAASRFSVGRLHVVAHRAVDVARREAGVGTGGEDRLERHVVLGAAEGLPERGLPDADDRRPVADRRRVHVSTPSSARRAPSARARPRTPIN